MSIVLDGSSEYLRHIYVGDTKLDKVQLSSNPDLPNHPIVFKDGGLNEVMKYEWGGSSGSAPQVSTNCSNEFVNNLLQGPIDAIKGSTSGYFENTEQYVQDWELLGIPEKWKEYTKTLSFAEGETGNFDLFVLPMDTFNFEYNFNETLFMNNEVTSGYSGNDFVKTVSGVPKLVKFPFDLANESRVYTTFDIADEQTWMQTAAGEIESENKRIKCYGNALYCGLGIKPKLYGQSIENLKMFDNNGSFDYNFFFISVDDLSQLDSLLAADGVAIGECFGQRPMLTFFVSVDKYGDDLDNYVTEFKSKLDQLAGVGNWVEWDSSYWMNNSDGAKDALKQIYADNYQQSQCALFIPLPVTAKFIKDNNVPWAIAKNDSDSGYEYEFPDVKDYINDIIYQRESESPEATRLVCLDDKESTTVWSFVWNRTNVYLSSHIYGIASYYTTHKDEAQRNSLCVIANDFIRADGYKWTIDETNETPYSWATTLPFVVLVGPKLNVFREMGSIGFNSSSVEYDVTNWYQAALQFHIADVSNELYYAKNISDTTVNKWDSGINVVSTYVAGTLEGEGQDQHLVQYIFDVNPQNDEGSEDGKGATFTYGAWEQNGV